LVISPDENKKTGQPLPIVQVYRKKTSYLTLIVQVYTGSKGETRIATLLLPPSLLLFVFASVIENGAGAGPFVKRYSTNSKNFLSLNPH